MRTPLAAPHAPRSSPLVLASLVLCACVVADPGWASPPVAATDDGTPAPAAPVRAPARAERTAPVLDHEPLLNVLLARAPRIVVQVDSATRIEATGLSAAVAPGPIAIEACPGGWRIAGDARRASGTGVLASGGRPIFTVEAIPEFGATRKLRIAGDLLVSSAGNDVELIERVPMEEYLAGVVAAEMNPKWPSEALAAQAIVARSYAAARWLERYDQSWQLHWHFGVDMAYHGWSAGNEALRAAIASTRGEVLMYRGFPVLALFHASSGGRTESFERVKPGVYAPDGKTPIAAAMPVVDDTAAMPGAEALGLSSSHGRWKTDVPLPEITSALSKWSAAERGRPRFGEVEGVSIAERHADSGRVASVSIRHRLDGKTRYTTLPATDFRLAVNPVRIRSVFWDRCVIASKEPGYLVLEGRGFGHGCGLSQVSAWYLAKQGEEPEAIVARFYAGARIERRY